MRELELQRALADLILEPEASGAWSVPGAVAQRRGLPPEDTRAMGRFHDRLQAYRELARLGLQEPIEDMFPVTLALLSGEGEWQACLDAFLQARVVESPYYRDIAPAFLGWLVASGWGSDRWPFLTELAHFELLEVLVAHHPESSVPMDLHPGPSPEDLLVLEPAAQVVAYAHAVHLASEEAPTPPCRPTLLLAYRDPHEDTQVMELTEGAAALLTRAQREPLGKVATDMGFGNLASLQGLLVDLQIRGAIAGYRLP